MRSERRLAAALAGLALALAATGATAQILGPKYKSLVFPDASTRLTDSQVARVLAVPAADRRKRMNGVLADRPDDVAAHALRALSEAETNDGAAALVDFEFVTAASVPDKYTRSYLFQFRAEALMMVGRDAEALTQAEESVALAPDEPFTLITRGWARYLNKQLAGARDDLHAYLVTEPYYGPALYRLAYVLEAQGDYTAAAEAFTQVEGLRGGSWIRDNVGRVWFGAGQFGRAATIFRAQLGTRGASSYTPLWLYLARVRADVADEAAAREELAKNAPAHVPRVWVDSIADFMLGRIDAPEFRRVADSGLASGSAANKPDGYPCEADYYTAEVLLAHGDRAAARPLLDEAVKICPSTYVETSAAMAEQKLQGWAPTTE